MMQARQNVSGDLNKKHDAIATKAIMQARQNLSGNRNKTMMLTQKKAIMHAHQKDDAITANKAPNCCKITKQAQQYYNARSTPVDATTTKL